MIGSSVWLQLNIDQFHCMLFVNWQLDAQQLSIQVVIVHTIVTPKVYHYSTILKVVYAQMFFVWFDPLRPINNISVKQGRVFLGWTSTKLG